MERVLIITHNSFQGSGTLGDCLRSLGVDTHVTNLYKGEELPDVFDDFSAVVTLGGAMNAYDDEHYPFLLRETDFLGRVVEANIPTLGICLGARLIARACHAPMPGKCGCARGWQNVFVTDEGRRDILFQGLPRVMQVFQWHEDAMNIPEGGLHLAATKSCPNQAFRYRNAYGLQFHVEANRDMLSQWVKDDPERDGLLRTFDLIEHDFVMQAKALFSNFLWLADIRRRAGGSFEKSRAGVAPQKGTD